MPLSRKDVLEKFPLLNMYQNLSGETAIYPGQGEFQGLCYVLFKLAGESGEIMEKMGKLLRGSTVIWGSNQKDWPQEVRDAFKKELGDVLWYVAGTAREMGFTLQDVAETNLDKLESREERGLLHGNGDNR